MKSDIEGSTPEDLARPGDESARGQANKDWRCYTIGHSSHPIEHFIQLLKRHGIDCVVDVRSWPHSTHAAQFDRERLSSKLTEHSISYTYLGDRLGGMYTDPKLLFPDGKVNYAKVRKTKRFKEGIRKLISKINHGRRVAIMCAEKDPFDCHRFVLISYQLTKHDVQVDHILDDGSVISNEALEEKLLKRYKRNSTQATLLGPPPSKTHALDAAYIARNIDISQSCYERSGAPKA
ncbi:MAG: DUF488 domain-containing protein [Candidatus Thermoplasmatota archaeon]